MALDQHYYHHLGAPLDMQILKPHRIPQSEAPGVGPSNLCFNKLSRQFWSHSSLRTSHCRSLAVSGQSYAAEELEQLSSWS